MKVPFRVFVTATDTGVGKTEASCALLELLAQRQFRPAAFKPYESGCADLDLPADAIALRQAGGVTDPLELVCPHRFELPLAPGVAAHRLGINPDFEKTMAAFRSFDGRPLVVEGAGGIRVPIDAEREVVDLIAHFGLPVLVVARAGLGTLNHTALTLEALQHRQAHILGVLLTKSSAHADSSEADNAAWLVKRHSVRVLGPIPHLPDAGARRRAFVQALAPLLS